MAALFIQSAPPILSLPTNCRSPSPKMYKTPLSYFSTPPKPRTASYQLKEGQSRLFHRLPSGLRMEFILHSACSPPTEAVDLKPIKVPNPSRNPPLLFVHGSFHAAWCWAEHWLPFFSSEGYDCYAVSLLGLVIIFYRYVWLQKLLQILSLCKETFFSSSMDEDLVLRYQELMREFTATTV